MVNASSPVPQTYEQLVEGMGEGLGNACRVYGINPLYGRLYAALFLAPEPISLPDLVEQLGIAKSTASVAVRRMVAFGAVRRVNKTGDRRDYYAVVDDPWAVLTHFLRKYVAAEMHEVNQVSQALQQGLDHTGEGWPEGEALDVVRGRATSFIHMVEGTGALLTALLARPQNIDREHAMATLGPLLASLTAGAVRPTDDANTHDDAERASKENAR